MIEMRLMRILATGFLALGLVATTAFAPVAAQGQQQVVTQFDDSTISRLLLDVQTTWQIEPGPDGVSIYRASADGGIAFTALPRACAPEQGCRALAMIAQFTRTDGRPLAELDNFLNTFNDRVPAGKVYRMNDGTVVLQGYINAAFGISYANAQAQLLVYGQNIQALRAGLEAFSEGR
ncbi:MAG: YbjN domain-containing protein [Erythrobacter sp.]